MEKKISEKKVVVDGLTLKLLRKDESKHSINSPFHSKNVILLL